MGCWMWVLNVHLLIPHAWMVVELISKDEPTYFRWFSNDAKFHKKGYDPNGNSNEFKGFQWLDYDNERAFKPNEIWNDEMMLMVYLAT